MTDSAPPCGVPWVPFRAAGPALEMEAMSEEEEAPGLFVSESVPVEAAAAVGAAEGAKPSPEPV